MDANLRTIRRQKKEIMSTSGKDFEWLVSRLTSVDILGGAGPFLNANPLHQTEQMESMCIYPFENVAEQDDKTLVMSHGAFLVDTIFFEKGKPVHYYFTKNVNRHSENSLSTGGGTTRSTGAFGKSQFAIEAGARIQTVSLGGGSAEEFDAPKHASILGGGINAGFHSSGSESAHGRSRET